MKLWEIMAIQMWATRKQIACNLIVSGFVSVNGEVMRDFYHECKSGDIVSFDGEVYEVA